MQPNTAKLFLFLSLLGAALLLITCSQSGSGNKPMTKEEMVKRGEYLTTIGSCNDCHSPKKYTAMGPVPDQSILLSGHPANSPVLAIPAGLPDPYGWVALTNANFTAWAGPWGVSFAANITPDKQTGIGNWTEDDFIKTIRSGKHLGTGRDILPPMPWPFISKMTDEDLKSVYAYLMSLPAIPNLVPGPQPPMAPPADTTAGNSGQ